MGEINNFKKKERKKRNEEIFQFEQKHLNKKFKPKKQIKSNEQTNEKTGSSIRSTERKPYKTEQGWQRETINH